MPLPPEPLTPRQRFLIDEALRIAASGDVEASLSVVGRALAVGSAGPVLARLEAGGLRRLREGIGAPMVLDRARGALWWRGHPVLQIRRSRLQAALLESVCTERADRASQYESVWGQDYRGQHSDNAVRTAIMRLRRALRSPSVALVVGSTGAYHLAPSCPVWQWGRDVPVRGPTAGPAQSWSLAGIAPPPRCVGRDDLLRGLDSVPLRTLRGPPGVGKTTLARQLASAVSRVAWVDLCDASSVVEALDMSGINKEIVFQAELLVLDNAEARVADIRACLSGWWDANPALQILVTSREALGDPREQVVDLPPLAPDEAVRLMTEVARELSPGVSLPDEARSLALELGGLPHGLVIAGRRWARGTMGVRAGTMDRWWATTRSSWELLGADEQRAMARLGEVPGAVSVESLAAIWEVESPVDLLDALVDQSVVQVVHRKGLPPSYRAAPSARGMVPNTQRGERGVVLWLAHLAREGLAVSEWPAARALWACGVRSPSLVAAIVRCPNIAVHWPQGPIREVLHELEPEVAPGGPLEMGYLHFRAWIAGAQGDLDEAIDGFASYARRAQERDDPAGQGLGLRRMAILIRRRDPSASGEALALLGQAGALRPEDPWVRIDAAFCALTRLEIDGAAEHLSAALRLALQSGDRRAERQCHLRAAGVAVEGFRLADARSFVELAESVGPPTLAEAAYAATMVVSVALAEEQVEEALSAWESARAKTAELGSSSVWLDYVRAQIDLQRGAVDAARARLVSLTVRGDEPGVMPHVWGTLGLVESIRGTAACEESVAAAVEGSQSLPHYGAWISIFRTWDEGDLDGAYRKTRALLEFATARGFRAVATPAALVASSLGGGEPVVVEPGIPSLAAWARALDARRAGRTIDPSDVRQLSANLVGRVWWARYELAQAGLQEP